MNFTYTLVNDEHLSDQQRSQIQDGLSKSAYVCQQEFEKALALYHQINVLFEADDEALVCKIELDGEDAWIDLDCSGVTFS